MPKITELYCFAIYDTDENDEGVPAILSPLLGQAMPLVGADITRIKEFDKIGQLLADDRGKEVRVYKFTHRETIATFTPRVDRLNTEPGPV